MEESKLYENSSTQDTSMTHSIPESHAAAPVLLKNPEYIYLFLYEPQLKSASLISHLSSLETPTPQTFPHLLSRFMLRPVVYNDNLELSPFFSMRNRFSECWDK